ncbi:MAG TPA: histidine phosphatase, partial [Alcanivorax sp.]|nr:histidine phosphatase [Alcanivorax sp.]
GEPRSRPGFRVGSVAALDVEVAASGGARLLWIREP